jgi:hypothetical protein
LLLGGFASATLKALWLDFYRQVLAETSGSLNYSNLTPPALTTDQVWWSSIGGEDMLRYYLPESVLDGADVLEDLPECVSNGDFSSSTGWSVSSPWAISGGHLVRSSASSSNPSALQSSGLAKALVTGALYKVIFTVSVSAGSVRVGVGGTLGTARSASGTYTEYLRAGSAGSVAVVAGDTFTGYVDNLSVRPLNTTLADDLFLRNEEGHRAMPWQGDVLWMLPMAEATLVFSASGVGALVPISAPVPTFGFRRLAEVGLGVRGAAGSTETEALFLDSVGVFHLIGADLTVQRLGYEEFGLPLVLSGQPVQIHRNPNRSEWHVSGKVDGVPRQLVLTPTGMGEANVAVCGMAQLNGYPTVVVEESEDLDLEVRFQHMEMGTEDLKNAFRVGASITGVAGLTGEMRWLNDRTAGDSSYLSSGEILFNPRGSIIPSVVGRGFELIVRGTPSSATKFDRLAVYWQDNDNRYTGEETQPNVNGYNRA